MKPINSRELCLTALFTAIIFLMTFIPKIPIPLGYAHLGDAAIFLAVLLLNKKQAALAAAIGSGLADFMGGFPLWIVPTLLIKYLMAWIFGSIYTSASSEKSINYSRMVLGLVVATLWMAGAYTIVGGILYDSLAAGFASTPGLLLKGALNLIIVVVIAKPLLKLKN